MKTDRIRNFCIVAHIDHGKSTLADRILLSTGTITVREFRDQVLDDMDLERERGITIKASSVRLTYRRSDGEYLLNLIDTPGHVDFGYEVVRSLRACEGAILLVDATQGIQAQTVANYTHCMEVGLSVIPVLNKIDLQTARPDEVTDELVQTMGFRVDEILRISAKEGIGVAEVLDAVVERVPPPKGSASAPLRARVFDSFYDDYRGVVILVRVVDGQIRVGAPVELHSNGRKYAVQELGVLVPGIQPCERLGPGEVGTCGANMREIQEVRVGETLTDQGGRSAGVEALTGCTEPLQVVFCGLFPVDPNDFEKLRDALKRLRLNDASFVFAPERSEGLGNGFRCGFLGLLHMEIIQERLEREWSLTLIKTAPNVTYEIELSGGKVERIDNPSAIPVDRQIVAIREPVVRTQILVPASSIGGAMHLSEGHRGTLVKTEHLGSNRVLLLFDLPLAEIIYDFHDQLKSLTHGYGTMDFDRPTYHEADLVRLDVLVMGRRVDALSCVVHQAAAARRGRNLLVRLRKEIARHQFEVVLQAAIGGKIVARESIKPVGKDVTAKCYGGDITRKRKLWEKQKEGKKRMKSVGLVDIPQEAFLKVLEPDRDSRG
ncbi:MAG: elongation factor 4 [Planctomycetes bacterium]|nr:elongation factor 4 [Planctomycetota bacterium]